MLQRLRKELRIASSFSLILQISRFGEVVYQEKSPPFLFIDPHTKEKSYDNNLGQILIRILEFNLLAHSDSGSILDRTDSQLSYSYESWFGLAVKHLKSRSSERPGLTYLASVILRNLT